MQHIVIDAVDQRVHGGVLSATRAYAEGESLWSKAQKQSVFQLLRYAQTRDVTHYENYRTLIRVTSGDRRAREEMQKERFDYAVAFQGLTEGRTHPDDIPHVVRLFRRFQHVPPITEVIETWTEGDQLIEQCSRRPRICTPPCRAAPPTQRCRPIADRILELDGALTPLEDRFTRKLGDAARLAQWVLLLVILDRRRHAGPDRHLPVATHAEPQRAVRACAQGERGALPARRERQQRWPLGLEHRHRPLVLLAAVQAAARAMPTTRWKTRWPR